MNPLTVALIIVFYISLVISIFIMHISKTKKIFIDKKDKDKPQKFHKEDTPRAGGIGIILAFLIGSLLSSSSIGLKLFISSIPIVLGGLLEDLGIKVKPIIRLLLAFSSAILAIYLTGFMVKSLGFYPFTHLPYITSFILTIFVVVGVTNSINIINGFNGLASGFSLIILTILALTVYHLQNITLLKIILILIFSTLGFFILNFPKGRIFLGDSGAYFLGFMLAELLAIVSYIIR